MRHGHRDERRADVDDPRVDEVRDQVLRDRERDAGDQDRRPHILHALPAGEGPDQPERHDQREERQLPSDHRTEQERIDAGDARQSCDRCAERAVGDRRRVGDQRESGGGKRREAEPDQDRAGHGDRCAEARGAFEECAEAERDQQQLQAAILGDAADRGLQRSEHTFLHRQPVEEDDVEHDPADREKARHRAEDRGADRHVGRHREEEDRDEVCDDERDHRREVRLHLVRRDEQQQRDHRQRGCDRRQSLIGEWVVVLIPHGFSSRVAPAR